MAPGREAPVPLRLEEVSRLRMAIMRVSRRIRQQSNLGVTPSQTAVLMTVARRGPSSLGDLAAHEGVQPPTVSRIVSVLEERGLLQRRPDPADGRVVRVELTAEGRAQVDAARSRSDTWLTRRLSVLDADARAELLRALPLLERLLEEPPT